MKKFIHPGSSGIRPRRIRNVKIFSELFYGFWPGTSFCNADKRILIIITNIFWCMLSFSGKVTERNQFSIFFTSNLYGANLDFMLSILLEVFCLSSYLYFFSFNIEDHYDLLKKPSNLLLTATTFSILFNGSIFQRFAFCFIYCFIYLFTVNYYYHNLKTIRENSFFWPIYNQLGFHVTVISVVGEFYLLPHWRNSCDEGSIQCENLWGEGAI